MTTTNVFTCPDCDPDRVMTPEGFIDHLHENHGIHDSAGRKTLSQHLRGTGFSQVVYEWEIGGKKFFQCITRKK